MESPIRSTDDIDDIIDDIIDLQQKTEEMADRYNGRYQI
jgi:hypothetical protein